MTTVRKQAAWAGLSYGATERLLADLHETSPESVRSRFRKLRLKPFPDEIRSGTGRRIVYDLPRILALAAVFDLNRLYVPQGRAVEMVETCWPEWCRAFIAAAVGQSLFPAPPYMPTGVSPSIRMLADAYRAEDGGPELLDILPGSITAGVRTGVPMIVVDAGRTVALLAGVVANDAALTAAFSDLERAFGWTPPSTPHRAAVAEMSRGRGFLDEGPFFGRATALLNGTSSVTNPDGGPISFARTQALIEYLEDPAPIDRWKAEIGEEEDRPRLGHLLSFWAASRGLKVRHSYPEIAKVLAGRNVREMAFRYIASATRGLPRGE